MHDDNDQGIRCTKMPLLTPEPIGNVRLPGSCGGQNRTARSKRYQKGCYACTRCAVGMTANRGKVCGACLRAQAQ
jgi:hypothetical protein